MLCIWWTVLWPPGNGTVLAQENRLTVVDFYKNDTVLHLELHVQPDETTGWTEFEADAAEQFFVHATDGMVAFGDGEIAAAKMSAFELSKPDAPPDVHFLLDVAVPEGARTVTFYWPHAFGGVVLRQQGVEDPFAGYFAKGEHTAAIPLSGGAARAPEEVAFENLSRGFGEVLPKGVELILLGVVIFFKRGWPGPLVAQIMALGGGHAIAVLALSFFSWAPPGVLTMWMVPAVTLLLALDNIFMRALHYWRLGILFALSALQSYAFAAVMENSGLSKTLVLPATAGFGAGLTLGLGTVVVAGYMGLGVWFGRHPKYRGRVIMPASLSVIGIVLYRTLA